MGKTTKSTGTNSRTTAKNMVKKLTPRRITMIKEFLTKTIDSPDNAGNFLRNVAWMDRLIEFMREPKRCRSTKMDIMSWLKDDCFEELIHKVIRSAAKKTEPMSGTMDQSINQVELEPMSSGEDIDNQTLLPTGAIKTEIVEVEEQFEDQLRVEHAGQTATGNQEQEEIWRLSAIKEETEMVLVKEELMLDDEFDEELGILKSENQGPKEEIPTAELDKHQCLNLNSNSNRSAVAVWHDMDESGGTDQVMEPEEPLGDSLCGYNVPVSSEEIPKLSTHIHLNLNGPPEPTQSQSDEQKNQLRSGVTFTRKESSDFIKKMSDGLMSVVQDRQRRNDVSNDWDSIYQSLKIVTTVLKKRFE